MPTKRCSAAARPGAGRASGAGRGARARPPADAPRGRSDRVTGSPAGPVPETAARPAPARTAGSPFGLHRVLEPAGVLPQAPWRLDPSPPIWPDEVLVRVQRLNLDAASFPPP